MGISRKPWRAPLRARSAIDAEALIRWVYHAQKAHLIEDQGVGLYEGELAAANIRARHVSADGVAQILKLGVLGCRIDGGGMSSGDLHPDAAAVHGFVKRLRANGYALTIWGRRGERPDWGEEFRAAVEPAWRDLPEYDAAGLPAPGSFQVRSLAQGRGGGSIPYLCPVVHCHVPAHVASLRAEYGQWWQALKATAEHFQANPDLLKSHEVTGPEAKAEPWVC